MHRISRQILKVVIVVAVSVLASGLAPGLVTTAQAEQQNRYSTWQDRTLSEDSINKIISELRDLINDADRQQAADPQFIRDLRRLVRRHEQPWQRLVFRDDFSDGNFTLNPTWTVSSGKFWVEPGYGLRSAPFILSTRSGKLSKEQLAFSILGTILNGNKNQQTGGQVSRRSGYATIRTNKKFNNAFRLRLEMTSWEARGHFEIGVYQDTNDQTGYRLVYRPGAIPAFKLVRVSRFGSETLGIYGGTLSLEDRRLHTIEMTRARSGQMVVSVDGREIISARDRNARGQFSGVVSVKQDGDFVIKSVALWDTPSRR